MEFRTTGLVEGATCMCEGFFCFVLFFSGWGGFNSSDLLKGFIIKAKKEQKKYFSSVTENIKNI